MDVRWQRISTTGMATLMLVTAGVDLSGGNANPDLEIVAISPANFGPSGSGLAPDQSIRRPAW